MILYRTPEGPVLNNAGQFYSFDCADWDQMLNQENLAAALRDYVVVGNRTEEPSHLLAPIGNQEVWASGVTYFRSRTARMEESKEAGGGSFYDRVYAADRPELFFKATPQRVVQPGGVMHRRSDSKWIVPEPELTLVINSSGKIVGFTCGNDLSCRDIEGENPLYLPQAKVFAGCASLGPGILVTDQPLAGETAIRLKILRAGAEIFAGETTLSQMKRSPEELAGWLFREQTFPQGAFLMTGTGIVPPDDFCLQTADEVRVTIDGIGTLVNTMD